MLAVAGLVVHELSSERIVHVLEVIALRADTSRGLAATGGAVAVRLEERGCAALGTSLPMPCIQALPSACTR